MDAGIFAALVTMGVVVLLHRKKRTTAFLAANGLVVVFFLYCLLSVMWSPFHDVALKRWVKAIGDLVMVLILATDDQPIVALRKLFSRVGFILLPFSVVLIRYSDLGRNYDPDGNPMNTGVTTNKNDLGVIVFAISLGALWNIRSLLKDREAPNRTRRLVAQTTLLAFGVALLQMSHCATAALCFVLGSGLLLATSLREFRKRPGRVRALCLLVVIAGGLSMLLGGGSAVSESLGRGNGLSGRTYIWAACIAAADNPLIGTGFESFWNANASKVNQILHIDGFINMSNLVSAHDGYLEVYLDLGWIGLGLIALILIRGYWHGGKAFREDPEFGGLLLAYITTVTFYNITEAGFRMLSVSWIFLLFAVVSVSGIGAGSYTGAAQQVPAVPRGGTNRVSLGSQVLEGYTRGGSGSRLADTRIRPARW